MGSIYLLAFGHRSNKLRELPESVGELASLEYLAMNSNRISAIPQSLEGCVKLSTVIANSNSLSEVPLVILSLPDLKLVNLSHNRIHTLQESVREALGAALPGPLQVAPGGAASSSPCSLQSLDLTGNPLLAGFDSVTLTEAEYHEPIIRDIQAKKARR
jgi:Leucine-rich repeat (LRR) protein